MVDRERFRELKLEMRATSNRAGPEWMGARLAARFTSCERPGRSHDRAAIIDWATGEVTFPLANSAVRPPAGDVTFVPDRTVGSCCHGSGPRFGRVADRWLVGVDQGTPADAGMKQSIKVPQLVGSGAADSAGIGMACEPPTSTGRALIKSSITVPELVRGKAETLAASAWVRTDRRRLLDFRQRTATGPS